MHKQTMEVLPWFVNDTLEGKEREQVLKHLAECEECRWERDRLTELQEMIREGEIVDVDVEFSVKRAMKRVEEAERNRRSVEETHQSISRSRFLIAMPIAAAIGLFLVGAAVYLEQSRVNLPASSEYQTLTAGQPGGSTQGAVHQIEIGFSDPIPAATLRQALIETRSNIVSGPDDRGMYVVEVVVPGEEGRNLFLNRMRGIEGVRHAAFLNK